MSSELHRAKQRYLTCRLDAYRLAKDNLAGAIDVDFRVSELTGRAFQAVTDQWVPAGRGQETAWDWAEINRRYREPDRLDMVIWAPGDRLCGIGLGVTVGPSVEIRFLEADPRRDCPLLGKRALIALEVAACYAQARGKTELRVRPLNSSIERLYREVYAFELVSPRREDPYLMRKV